MRLAKHGTCGITSLKVEFAPTGRPQVRSLSSPRMKESRLQLKIRHALEREFPASVWWKTHGGPFTPAGIPDLVGVVRGRMCAFEVKRPGHDATLVQTVTIERLTSAYAISCVVTSVDEAIEAVKYGLRPQFGDTRLSERFWGKVEIGGEFQDRGPCWLWIGTPSTEYGVYRVGSQVDGSRRQALAHRFSYELLVGEIPSGEIDHECDHPRCVNPNHLVPKTPKENTRRSRSTKLTLEQVTEIRKLRASGLRLAAIAPKFGVSRAQISSICTGRS